MVRKYFSDLEVNDNKLEIINKENIKETFDLVNGLTNYWKLDETSGTRFDSVGNDDLIDNNTVESQSGVIGNEALFVGSNNEGLSSNSFNTPVNNVTFSGWVSLNSKSSVQIVYGKYGDGTFGDQRGFELYYNSSTDNYIFLYSVNGASSGDRFSNFNFTPEINRVYFIVSTLDTNLGRVINYVDGIKDSEYNYTPGNIFDSNVDFFLGRNANGFYLTGTIDEFGIWDRVLTSDEIKFLYNKGRGRNYWSTTERQDLIKSKKITTSTDLFFNILEYSVLFVETSTDITIEIPSTLSIQNQKIKIVHDNFSSGNVITIQTEGLTLTTLEDSVSEKSYVELLYQNHSWRII